MFVGINIWWKLSWKGRAGIGSSYPHPKKTQLLPAGVIPGEIRQTPVIGAIVLRSRHTFALLQTFAIPFDVFPIPGSAGTRM